MILPALLNLLHNIETATGQRPAELVFPEFVYFELSREINETPPLTQRLIGARERIDSVLLAGTTIRPMVRSSA